MRIWTISPEYLDAKGIVALWRETLLAQNVLLGKTKGYKNHPQLNRFKAQNDPVDYICSYLHGVCDAAYLRKYNFNRDKITLPKKDNLSLIHVNSKQVEYEWQHLLNKLETRDNTLFNKLSLISGYNNIPIHPLFKIVPGDIESWEIL